MESYLIVTAHYINRIWELQAFVLETLPFPEGHKGVNIADKSKALAERWEIKHSVIMDSHDQGSNMKAAKSEKCNWRSLHCTASLAWPDRFFLFFFVVAEKRLWCNSTSRLVLATIQILEMLIGEDGE